MSDTLFKHRVLTRAVNDMRPPGRRIFQRYFAPLAELQGSSALQFDVISGSEGILGNIAIDAPATVTDKTGRKTITLEAPRLSHKRFISAAELDKLRGFGEIGPEMLLNRVSREQVDMRNMSDRTLEYWAANVLRGQILDVDGSVLVDYNLDTSHKPVLTGAALWSDAASAPINDIRNWKETIETDGGHEITEWQALCGGGVMDAMLKHDGLLELLKYNAGEQIARTGTINRLGGVEVEEYNASFKDGAGARQRFIPDNVFALVGYGPDVFDCPYAPIIDLEATGGIGNVVNGQGELFFSKSWLEEDPSGRWIKQETRPLPVLRRPGAVIWAVVI